MGEATTVPAAKSSAPARAPAIPPLQNGDHLTRLEFERRYEAMPDVKKAELIEGIVYMPSPVNHEMHSNPHIRVGFWVAYYSMRTPFVEPGDNATVRLDLDNEPQPDVNLFIRPEYGGQIKLVDGFIEGAPEFVAEVANSSTSIDLHPKFKAYRRNGIREYLVWRVADGEVDWFVLRGGEYEKLALSSDGLFRSTVFPGLWLNPAALLKNDLVALASAVEQGCATPEHAAFVKTLQQNAQKPR
jgi:Uma2 family endonuclease